MDENPTEFVRKKHVKYLKQFLRMLPGSMCSYESLRLTIAFFAVSGLDVLDALDEIKDWKEEICNWVYSLQVLPSPDGDMNRCGFQGADTFTMATEEGRLVPCNAQFANGHLAHTYTALCILLILGDDLSRLDRDALAAGVRALQQQDGSFCATQMGSENDMRFVYCAACVCYILQDWSGMNVERTIQYITKSLSYESGFGQGPYLEAHGGVTYCAVASLSLMGALRTSLSDKQISGLKRWAIMRQESGFQGRANKQIDSCYSFWIGASLKMLNFFEVVNFSENRAYLLSTQDGLTGGFSKWTQLMPDPLHTYLALGGLSMMGEEGLLEINPALNITKRASRHLKNIHEGWK